MGFRDTYQLREDGIYVLRGKFREKDWYEMCYAGTLQECKIVYILLETVYNHGEHDGRTHVRRGVIEALGLDL
jgi:hypothetical protein